MTLSILGAVILTFATGGRCDFHCLHWGVILIVATGGRCDRWEINRRCEPWGESLSPLGGVTVTVVLQGDIVGPPRGHQSHCGPPKGRCWVSLWSSKETLVA